MVKSKNCFKSNKRYKDMLMEAVTQFDKRDPFIRTPPFKSHFVTVKYQLHGFLALRSCG